MIGEKVLIKLHNDGIKKITINENPFILIIDNLGFYNQVSGNKMISNIKNNKNIDKALFIDNVDTYYYLISSDNKLTGVNNLQCSKFCAVFDDKNKLNKIFFDKQISGKFFFPDYIEQNKQKLILERLASNANFIQSTKKPDINEIKKKNKRTINDF
jgi:hypothetical protein